MATNAVIAAVVRRVATANAAFRLTLSAATPSDATARTVPTDSACSLGRLP
jgi:hypothetical protein